MALTPRGKDLRWLTRHRYITEQPANSNRDDRADGITAAQKRLGAWLVGQPWCGVWAANALTSAGVEGVTWRLASVRLIELDAKAGKAPFHDWQHPSAWRKVMRGDLVVLFGPGVHVATVRAFKRKGGTVWVRTDEGNTSSGVNGSQSNGGGSYPRWRPLGDVYGFARVDYPGGWERPRRMVNRLSMATTAAVSVITDEPPKTLAVASSDRLLMEGLRAANPKDRNALSLYEELRGVL